MRRRWSTGRAIFKAIACLLVSTGLWFLPETLVQRVRGAVLDSVQPGLRVIRECERHWSTAWNQLADENVRQLREERDQALADAERASAHCQVLLARQALANEVPLPRSIATVESNPSGAAPLFLPAIVEARVIGQSLAEEWRSGRILDRGWSSGVRESALVLRSRQPLIDLGEKDQIATDDPLLIGSAVIGKVLVVGHWSSTYLPVTDPEFRAPVQLIHATERGAVWGAKGVLVGDRTGCRMQGVDVESPVRVGDGVYGADRDGTIEAPLYYGEVTEVSLSGDQRSWDIRVQPARTPCAPSEVRILRAALNPVRLLDP